MISDSASIKHTRIIRILFLPETLDRAIECREHATPHTEVTTKNGRSCLDSCDRAYASLAVGTVSETFHTVPDRATNGLIIMSVATTITNLRVITYTHRESTSEVRQGDPIDKSVSSRIEDGEAGRESYQGQGSRE